MVVEYSMEIVGKKYRVILSERLRCLVGGTGRLPIVPLSSGAHRMRLAYEGINIGVLLERMNLMIMEPNNLCKDYHCRLDHLVGLLLHGGGIHLVGFGAIKKG